MAIVGCKDRRCALLLQRERPGRGFPANLEPVVRRKLAMLDAADRLDDLRFPPGNRLEALRADREGQHSIRVNDQFRLCFVWTAQGPADVELVDYH